MTSRESREAVESLDRMLPLAPDLDRAERVRVRCRTQLGRSRQRSAHTAVMCGFAWHVLAPAVVGGICALYAVALVVTTLRLEGVFQ